MQTRSRLRANDGYYAGKPAIDRIVAQDAIRRFAPPGPTCFAGRSTCCTRSASTHWTRSRPRPRVKVFDVSAAVCLYGHSERRTRPRLRERRGPPRPEQRRSTGLSSIATDSTATVSRRTAPVWPQHWAFNPTLPRSTSIRQRAARHCPVAAVHAACSAETHARASRARVEAAASRRSASNMTSETASRRTMD